MVELFPICRSLTGPGVRQTLKMIQEIVPIHVFEEPSGNQVFDWVIPQEWSIDSAWIEDMSGNRVVDFANNNLHVMSYSQAVDKVMSRDELESHLYSLDDLPQAIPYTTSYYRDDWKFCLSKHQKDQLNEPRYRAVINSRHYQGSLTWAEVVIPGVLKDEILFSCNICHPSLASNELSGPVLATYLARELLQTTPRYTYRFAFVPETIGCLTFLKHRLQHLKEFCKAGFVLTCLGDANEWSVVKTKSSDSLADKAAMAVLRHRSPLREYPWFNRGSDERQYNFPTVNIPAVCLSRSKFGEYTQYHTSLDNLDFVTENSLYESFQMLAELIEVLEANQIYRVTSIGEPFLSKKGLYPAHSTRFSGHGMKPLMNFLNACNGQRCLTEALEYSLAPARLILDYLPSLIKTDVLKVVEHEGYKR